MNSCTLTGYLVREGWRAVTPAGAERLQFEVMAQAQGDAEPTPWHCEIESPEVIARARDFLTAGRGVLLRAQLAGRPYLKAGVRTGFVRYLRVEEIQFVRADRGGLKVQPGEEETAEVAEP